MKNEVKNSLIEFCNKNGIQWMPINLKIKDGKKDLENNKPSFIQWSS
jgi:hypothetical protein